MDLLQHDNRMTAREIAAELGCSIKTVYQWSSLKRFAKEMPIHKSANNQIFAYRDDVMRFKKIYIPRGGDAARGGPHSV